MAPLIQRSHHCPSWLRSPRCLSHHSSSVSRISFNCQHLLLNNSKAHSRLKHGWKSWRAHCLTFALDNRHYKTDCRLLLQCSVTYSRPKALRRRYQDVGRLEVKVKWSTHWTRQQSLIIARLTKSSTLQRASFNRLTKSASSPDCSNLLILSPLTVGRVRGWQDILLKVFESKIGCFHLQLFSM